jgi:4-carboxymuconolactone decarboxylase
LPRKPEDLVRNQNISDETWRALAQRYSQTQLMEVVGLVGCYTMLAMIMKAYGVQLESSEALERLQEQRDYT